MSFQPDNLIRWTPSVPSDANSLTIPLQVIPVPGLPQYWGYQAGNDSMSTVLANGYFYYFAGYMQNLLYNDGNYLQVGDLIYAVCADGSINLVVTAINPIITTAEMASTPSSWITRWFFPTINTTMIPNAGYCVAGTGPVTLTLPVVCPQSSVIIVTALTNSWTLNLNAGQTVVNNLAAVATTSVVSNTVCDTIFLLCATTNTTFIVFSEKGTADYT